MTAEKPTPTVVISKAINDHLLDVAIDWWPDTDAWAERIVVALSESHYRIEEDA